jgi:hypothetical protein
MKRKEINITLDKIDIEKNMPVDYKYSLFNKKNDKLSIFCIITHRYGKQKISINEGFMDTCNLPLIHSHVIN